MGLKREEEQQESKFKIDWKLVAIGVFAVGAIFFGDKAKANQYAFPAAENITMDVQMVNGRSGTYKCASARDCYVKALKYEARGAQQYCVSLVMKRDGKVIWWRKYQ